MRMKRTAVLIIFFSSLVFAETHAVNMGDCALGALTSIEGFSGRYYILDKMQRRIFSFDNKSYLGSIGRTGQGPGEFQYPAALSVYKKRIYCVDRFSGSVSVFDHEGKVYRYFKLKEQDQNMFAYIADLEACDDGFLVAFEKGPFILRLYDKEGKFIRGLERKDHSYRSIAHVYDITIGKQRKEAYVFSRFDSSLLVVSLPDLHVLGSLKSFKTYREKQIQAIIHDKSTNSEASRVFNTFYVFSPLMIEDAIFIAIPNPSMETKVNTATSVDKSLDIKTLKTFPIEKDLQEVPGKVIRIKKVGKKILLVNDFGDLFIKDGPF